MKRLVVCGVLVSTKALAVSPQDGHGEAPSSTASDSVHEAPSAGAKGEERQDKTAGAKPMESAEEKRVAEPHGVVDVAAGKRMDAVAIGGYVEAFYQWNFNGPANGVTAYRGFDNRHNTLTLSNVALDAQWNMAEARSGGFGQLTLQVGHTPSTYFSAEPSVASEGGASASSADVWKYVQQAYGGFRFGKAEGAANSRYSVAAGVFLSPIGPETVPVRDNWNWSRSNAFYSLPFYHTGVRATVNLTPSWEGIVAVYNGWNSVVDGNDEKSLSVQARYTGPSVTMSILYFGGVERPPGALEGRPWRNLFDAHGQWTVSSRWALMAHANGGFEVTRWGASSWVAGAAYAKVALAPEWSLAARIDGVSEDVGANAQGRATRLFYPAPWVASSTVTVSYAPAAFVVVRLEGRHDAAGAPIYFGDERTALDAAGALVAKRSVQQTLTLGLVVGF